MSQPSTIEEEFITANLKHNVEAAPRRAKAASLVLKQFMNEDRYHRPEDIQKKIEQEIGLHLPHKFIVRGLYFLRDSGSAIVHGKKWKLSSEALAQCAQERIEVESFLKSILKRHFPENDALASWLKCTCVEIFSTHANNLIKGIRESEGVDTFEIQKEDIHAGTTGIPRDTLFKGFQHFLISEHPDDRAYIASITQTIVTSKLLIAEVGFDDYSLRKISEGIFILDTNVLLSIALDRSPTLPHLLNAAKKIGCTLALIDPTKEEYESTLMYYWSSIESILQTHAHVRDLIDDDFVKVTRRLGCNTREDFEVFVGTIQFSNILTRIGATVSTTVEEAIKSGESDLDLHTKIRNIDPNKKPRAVLHDSSLIHVAEHQREKGQKSWILTEDQRLHDVAAKRSGAYDQPTTLTIKAATSLFAINDAGHSNSSYGFSPIFSKMLVGNSTIRHGFELEDLRWFEANCAYLQVLTESEQKAGLESISSARMRGKDIDSDVFKLAFLNTIKKEDGVNEQLKVAKELAKESEREANTFREMAINEKAQSIRRDLLPWFVFKIACYEALATASLIAIITEATLLSKDLGWANAIVTLAGASGSFPTGRGIFTTIARHRKNRDNAIKQAEKEISQNI